MKSQNGTEYAQNYDVIVKWMAEALRGETLEVLGIKTGRIEEVFSFEPIEIAVKAGRLDVIVKDDTKAVYHIEEQRNMKKSDLYRFGSYHFQAARQWPDLKDIILISGSVYNGPKIIETKSGKYKPVIIDLTKRDGKKRLLEIREAVASNTFHNWLELVFLPLYGQETGTERSEMVEQVLHFETELYQAEKISARLLAATLIMSNKLINKERLKELWEDIKMLDILEIAREKGLEEGLEEGKIIGVEEGKAIGVKEGKAIGVKEGKIMGLLEIGLEMLMDILIEKFRAVSAQTIERIRSIRSPDILKVLHRQALKCKNIQEFEDIMDQMMI